MIKKFSKKVWFLGLIIILVNILVFSLILILSQNLSGDNVLAIQKFFWLTDDHDRLSIMYLPFLVVFYGLYLIIKVSGTLVNRIKCLVLLLLYVTLIYIICYLSFIVIFLYGTYLITGVMPH